ncbi:hypothetical protein [Streptomyces sp. NBC_01197]|uniref:hypothetical protein n=1 Tax=Streptomyces sp. NBC_01197 TaxID=2903768 RepID=UPI002E130D34|nr:hypothetical protein OG452_35200 [Streptomyces sp. NBC_01197]
MSDTTEPDAKELAHQEEISGLMPVLSALDKTGRELDQQVSAGREVTAGQIAVYETQAAHARHLVSAAGASTREITEAEREHRGDGDRGFTGRGLDHATHTRHFEPLPAADKASTDRDIDEEEIAL